MVQVDVFWGYAWGGCLAAAAGPKLLEEEKPFASEYFVQTMVFLSLFWAPTGLLLLLRHPSWETMQAAENLYSLSEWLILGFGMTNITQGMLGFWAGYHLLRRGSGSLVHLNWLLGYYGMFFILLYGWDGLGYDRFLYDRDLLPGSPAWAPGAGTEPGVLPALARFLNSGVAWTLYTDGVWLLPPFFYLVVRWVRRSAGASVRPARLIAKKLAAVFVLGLGGAAFSALLVRAAATALGVGPHVPRALGLVPADTPLHVLSYLIGLPLSWLLLYALFLKPGRPADRYLLGLLR